MTVDALRRRVAQLTDRQLFRYRREWRLYPPRVVILEQEAARRERARRPTGRTKTIIRPSRLNP